MENEEIRWILKLMKWKREMEVGKELNEKNVARGLIFSNLINSIIHAHTLWGHTLCFLGFHRRKYDATQTWIGGCCGSCLPSFIRVYTLSIYLTLSYLLCIIFNLNNITICQHFFNLDFSSFDCFPSPLPSFPIKNLDYLSKEIGEHCKKSSLWSTL